MPDKTICGTPQVRAIPWCHSFEIYRDRTWLGPLAAHGLSTSFHPDTTREAGQISTDPDFKPSFIDFVGGGTGDLKSQIGRNESRSGIIEGLAGMGRRDPKHVGSCGPGSLMDLTT